MTTLRKLVLPMKLLLFTCQSKMKKPKELTTLLWVLFELFLLNKNSVNYYEPKLQKRLFIYGIKALLFKALLLHTKISKVRNHTLVIFVFLDVKSGSIYPRKSAKSEMIDLIRAFTLAIKVPISIRYMILTMVKFLS